MATALPLYTPVAHDQSVLSMLSPSHVTLYCRSTHMSSLCELRHGGKKKTLLNESVHWDQSMAWWELKSTLSWTVLSRVY